MGKKIYSFFCLFCALFGGCLTASAQAFEAAPISSLEEITSGENTYYALMAVDKKNAAGAWNSRNETFLFVNSANASKHYVQFGTAMTKDDVVGKLESNPEYFFKLEASGDGYKFQNLKTGGYFYQTEVSGKTFTQTMSSSTEEPGVYTFEAYAEDYNGSKTFSIKDGSKYLGQYSSGANVNNDYTEPGKFTFVIYKVAASATAINASFYYYNADGTQPLNSDAFIASASETAKTVGALSKALPAYISATFYADEAFTAEVAPETEVTASTTYYVKTYYNENFKFPHTSNEYFALKMGDNYLGTYFGVTAPNNENKYSIATTIDGDWYKGFSIIGYNGKKLYYDGTYINWSETEDYKWKISNDMKFTIQDGTKYLAVYPTNCLASASYAAELASSDAATAILGTVTATEPEYVGQLPYETSGLTFDQIVKGIDLTNGTYYFIEKATDASTVLSSSDATATFGGSAASATFETKANKGFNELWQYQDGYFIHANSGLKLTASALDASGTVWHKTATGTAQAYKLNNGTADFTAAENDTWKFRLAKSVTISLTEKNGTSYATTCAPVALTLPEDDTDTKLYIEKSHTENSLSVVPATAVAANTGIYIENTSGATSATLLFAESGTAPSADAPILYGTNVTLDISSDDHSFYRTLGFNSADKIGFFKPSNSIDSIPANRAFLHFTSAPTSAFYIDFDGTTTGIDTLLPAAAAELDQNAPVYDLSGRRMQGTLRTGIYLQNGHKFMVK